MDNELRRAAELVLRLVEITVTLHDRNLFRPNPGSQAAAEHDDESRFASPGEWGPDPVRQVYSTAALLLSAVDDNLQGIYRLLIPEALGVALTASSRSAVELCARAYWIMDPGIDVRNRIARGMTERLASLREQKKLPIDPEERARAARRVAGITSAARRLRFQIRTDRRGPQSIGKPRPPATELVARLMDGRDPRFGEVLYRTYSATSHGTLYGITTHLRREPDPTGQHELVAKLDFDPRSVLTIAGAVVLAYQRTIDRQVALYGWDPEEWRREAIEILRVFRMFIVP
jgi:hypothetical protein